MRERNFLVQAFYYGSDNSLELWEQRYFTDYGEAVDFSRFLFMRYDQVMISKLK